MAQANGPYSHLIDRPLPLPLTTLTRRSLRELADQAQAHRTSRDHRRLLLDRVKPAYRRGDMEECTRIVATAVARGEAGEYEGLWVLCVLRGVRFSRPWSDLSRRQRRAFCNAAGALDTALAEERRRLRGECQPPPTGRPPEATNLQTKATRRGPPKSEGGPPRFRVTWRPGDPEDQDPGSPTLDRHRCAKARSLVGEVPEHSPVKPRAPKLRRAYSPPRGPLPTGRGRTFDGTLSTFERVGDLRLIRRVQRFKDRTAFDALLRRYCYFPHYILGWGPRGSRQVKGGLDGDDFMQTARKAFLRAVESFDPHRGASFETFAKICIKRAKLDLIKTAKAKKHGPLNRSASLDKKVDSAEDTKLLDLIPDRRAEELLGKVLSGENFSEAWFTKAWSVMTPRERQAITAELKGQSRDRHALRRAVRKAREAHARHESNLDAGGYKVKRSAWPAPREPGSSWKVASPPKRRRGLGEPPVYPVRKSYLPCPKCQQPHDRREVCKAEAPPDPSEPASPFSIRVDLDADSERAA
jgi:Sigma-70 region 2